MYADSYSEETVSEHNTPADCYVIYENKVYNITKYLRNHDRYLITNSWVETDITQDFQTKNGQNRDHKPGSYSLLENYYIGDIASETTDIPQTENTSKTKNPYTSLSVIVITLAIYCGLYYIYKRNKFEKNKIFTKMNFNFISNTLLVILLMPSVGIGVFMILRYSYPDLYNNKFDFLYQHVELCIVMSVLMVTHFIQKLIQYVLPIKIIKSK